MTCLLHYNSLTLHYIFLSPFVYQVKRFYCIVLFAVLSHYHTLLENELKKSPLSFYSSAIVSSSVDIFRKWQSVLLACGAPSGGDSVALQLSAWLHPHGPKLITVQ